MEKVGQLWAAPQSGGSVGQVSGGSRCPPRFECRFDGAAYLFLKRSVSIPGLLQKKKKAAQAGNWAEIQLIQNSIVGRNCPFCVTRPVSYYVMGRTTNTLPSPLSPLVSMAHRSLLISCPFMFVYYLNRNGGLGKKKWQQSSIRFGGLPNTTIMEVIKSNEINNGIKFHARSVQSLSTPLF